MPETTTLSRLLSSLAWFRRKWFANLPSSCSAIFLESIPFYLFDRPTARPPITPTPTPTPKPGTVNSSQSPNWNSSLAACYPQQRWLHRHLNQAPRPRPPSPAPLVRQPGRTRTTLSHRSPTIPASCLPQSSSSVPFPTTRGPTLRVEEVCTKWRNNRTRPVGGGPVRSSRSTTSLRSLSNSSVTALHCLMAMRTGSTRKVCPPMALHHLPKPGGWLGE